MVYLCYMVVRPFDLQISRCLVVVKLTRYHMCDLQISRGLVVASCMVPIKSQLCI